MSYLWNKKSIPHKGWINQGCEDLEEATHKCEMCDKEEIRYVHTMYHPEAPKYFKVGCVCAEKLTNDYDTPKQQLKEMMKQTNWINHNWKKLDLHEYESKNFNSVFGRVTVGVFKVDNHYQFHIDNIICTDHYTTKNEAKRFVYKQYK